MLKSIEEIYYIIDEIVKYGIQNTKRGRRSELSISEIITILIEGHKRHYSTENNCICLRIAKGELKSCFQKIPCYPNIINQDREIISVVTTKANIHDIQLLKDHKFITHVKGILLGDKGYIASESHRKMLHNKGIQLIVKQRKNMNSYLNEYYSSLLKKRRYIESIFGCLKTRVSPIFPFKKP